MAVVAAWAVVAAADILGRAYARTRTAPSIIPMPTVLHARDTRRADEDCVVAAVRVDATQPDDPTFLVVKADGAPPEWLQRNELSFR
jgi:hypothetical protein